MNSKGKNSYVEKFMKYIPDKGMENINYFLFESINRNYKKINNSEVLNALLMPSDCSYEDSDFLLNYSGFNYRHINAVLRGTWNYEKDGDFSKQNEYRAVASKLQNIIMSTPTELTDDIIVYRGVDLKYFKQYGIESLDDLKALEGQFMIERGFISTSLYEESCYFKKENTLGLNYNVKMEYMVPKEFRDGIYLNAYNSYSPNQQEFLINSANLSIVNSVVINDDNTAILRLSLIPKELYDEYYSQIANDRKKGNK